MKKSKVYYYVVFCVLEMMCLLYDTFFTINNTRRRFGIKLSLCLRLGVCL